MSFGNNVSLSSDKNLDLYLKNNLNVIISGLHGVGKTTKIKEAFERNKLEYKIFSGATLDPWIDFIGVPREVNDENGEPYLDMVMPRHFRDDQVEAIFMDEYNRTAPAVRNAMMELIQFKSINGRKFNNLKVVWAAINPEDEGEYDVEPVDPAQMDRFHVQIKMSSKPSIQYFTKKFGAPLANAAIEHWNKVGSSSDDGKSRKQIQAMVSPRRLESAIELYKMKVPLEACLPAQFNPIAFKEKLESGDKGRELHSLYQKMKLLKGSSDMSEVIKMNKLASKLVNDKNIYKACRDDIHGKWNDFFGPLVNKELTTAYSSSNKYDMTTSNSRKKSLVDIITSLRSGTNKSEMQNHILPALEIYGEKSNYTTIKDNSSKIRSILIYANKQYGISTATYCKSLRAKYNFQGID